MANLVADIVSGRDWRNNVGNTVFQPCPHFLALAEGRLPVCFTSKDGIHPGAHGAELPARTTEKGRANTIDQCFTKMAMRGSAMACGIPDGACNPSYSRHGCTVDFHRARQSYPRDRGLLTALWAVLAAAPFVYFVGGREAL